MTYIPIKIYPIRSSIRCCLLLAVVCMVLAFAGFLFSPDYRLKIALFSFFMVGFSVGMLNAIAVTQMQPMIKILEDKFLVYTPFGYALIRFVDVESFRNGNGLFANKLCVEIKKKARIRFKSRLGRLLYRVVFAKPSYRVSISGRLLGADPESVIGTLEKRRQAALQPREPSDYRAEAYAMAETA